MSNNKLVFLLVFLCAAIMSSVFIYRSNVKPEKLITLSENTGTLLPMPRDIKPFELMTGNNQTFTERDFRNHWTLVFFGFTHCANICPTTLDMISKAYPDLKTISPTLKVVLISLDPERDNPEQILKYTKNFNDEFVGVTGKLKEIRKLQGQLNIYSAKDDSIQGENYQIQHTSSVLLINPQGKWAGIYPYGLTPKQFVKSFKESMQHLAS